MTSLWTGSDVGLLLQHEAALLRSASPNTFVQRRSAGLHYVEVYPSASAPGPDVEEGDRLPLVFLAGYGGSAGWWFLNAARFANVRGLRVLLVDHLGTGGSDRPSFPRGATEEAEAFFTSSLDAWRASLGLRTLCLIGHSLGGYIAGAYAVRFPARVAFLGLCSPAGLPDPYPLPDPEAHRGGGGDDALLPPPRTLSDSWVYGLVRRLWSWDYTPHCLIRSVGPLGRAVVAGGMSRRMTRFVLDTPISGEQVGLLASYLHQNLTLPASGEYALNAFLCLPHTTGHLISDTHVRSGHLAEARCPLAPRLFALLHDGGGGGRGDGSDQPPPSFPVVITYGGSHDWMVSEAGPWLVEGLVAGGRSKHGSEWAHSQLRFLPRSGHHCYLENPGAFNDVYVSALEALLRRRQEAAGGGKGGGL